MIDLSVARSGELGSVTRFSDLFASASLSGFTGGLLVRSEGDRALFFRDGLPVHAAGAGFRSAYLGELLLARGAITEAQLSDALARQGDPGPSRPLLGALLVASAGLDPQLLLEVLSRQIEERIFSVFGVTSGAWQSAPGENARIREIGVPCQSRSLLVRGLEAHASDDELREASDTLLGKAVQLSGALPPLELGPVEQKILRYLEKPRKPDQLERALGDRRRVRAVLRLLLVLDRAKILPAGKGIPIPKATLVKSQPGTGSLGDHDPSGSTPVFEQSEPPAPLPRAPSTSRPDAAFLAEVRGLHAELERKSHFELLGVTRDAPPSEVKKAYHGLAKRFHPDAAGASFPEDVIRMIRDISARLNEAHQVLSGEKSRAEYVALLADDRIKGDARKADRIRDAEVKHQMGHVMMKKREYQKAREYFNFAVQSDPASGEYKASLAWSMFADSKYDREEALTRGYSLILEALETKSSSATTHYYAGQILKAKQQPKDALFHFQRAVELDPKHADAAREVRLMELRNAKEQEAKESSNPLRKLFKR